MSPLAFAKTDVRIVGMDLSASRAALEDRDAPALVRARWFAELARQTDERALTLPEPWDPLRAAALHLPRDVFVDRSAVPLEQTESPAPTPAPESPEPASSSIDLDLDLDLLAFHGADFIQDHARSGASAMGPDTTAGFMVSSSVASGAPPMSAHAARLWESLFAEMPEEANGHDEPEALAERRVDKPIDAWFTLDSLVATAATGATNSKPTVQRAERSQIGVATQSSVVLRSLQAILSDERDEVGAIRADDAIASTQAGQVLSARSGLSPAHAEPETPAARRERKRAAARLKAEAVRTPANVASAAVAAPEGLPLDIDLMEPLIGEHAMAAGLIKQDEQDEQVALAMEAVLWPEIMGVDINLGTPFIAKSTKESTAVTPPVVDDRQASLTTEIGPWPGVMGVDIDLAMPFVAEPASKSTDEATSEPTAAAPSFADGEQTAPVTQTASWPELMDIDIDLSQPFAAESPVAVASPGADEPPALATESATLPAVTVAVPAPEADRKSRPSPFGSELLAVSEKSLDAVRGGFVSNGLNISFGIERAVYINGALVTTTSLNMADLGRLTAGRGAPVLSSGSLGLIQSGSGNTVAPGTFSSGSIGTVIQNTLDGQKIQNVTVINATTNSLGLLKGMNMESSLRGAISDSLRR